MKIGKKIKIREKNFMQRICGNLAIATLAGLMTVAVLEDIVGLGGAAVLDGAAGPGMAAGLEMVAGHISFALTLYEHNPYLSDILILATFLVVLNNLSHSSWLSFGELFFCLSHALITIECWLSSWNAISFNPSK